MNSSKIINASNILLGGTQVNNLYIGSNKIWSKSSEQTFDLLPIVMDSDSYLRLSPAASYAVTGNTAFIMKPLSNENFKLSQVNIDYLRCVNENDDITSNKVHVQKIDDYALLFTRLYRFDDWSGGMTGSIFTEYTNISLNNQTKQLTFKGKTDENNTRLLRGKYVSRVIKVPACGMSGIEKVYMYPYTFYSDFYAMQTFNIYYLDYNDSSNERKNNYLWDNDSQTFNKDGVVKTLNDTLFSSLNINYESLECSIEYSIGQNTTNQFRETVLYGAQVLLHFIQEPHNDHRVYIRRDIRRGLDSKYVQDSDTNFNYLFYLSTSKIINNSIEFACEAEAATYRNATGQSSTGTYILYPLTLENEYNIITSGTCTLDNNLYTWDNMQFRKYRLSRNSKIIFDKR
jgi:hypothetical protein